MKPSFNVYSLYLPLFSTVFVFNSVFVLYMLPV